MSRAHNQRPQGIACGVAGLLLLAILGGCSGGSRGDEQSAARVEGFDLGAVTDLGVLPTDHILWPSPDRSLATIEAERRQVMTECLTTRGFDFDDALSGMLTSDFGPSPVDDNAPFREQFAWVEQNGYGFDDLVGRLQSVEETERIFRGLPDPHRNAVSDCLNEARSVRQNSRIDDEETLAILIDAADRIMRDPDVVATFTEQGWIECMSNLGYNYTSKDDHGEALLSLFESGALTKQQEIAISTDDFQCLFVTEWIPRRAAETRINIEAGLHQP